MSTVDTQMQDSPAVAEAQKVETETAKDDLPEDASETIYIKNLNEKVKLPSEYIPST